MRKHASIIAGLLATTALVSPAMAQTQTAPTDQDQPAEVDEIVVTGIRASQQQAINIKRNEAAIVDAISAEDIGKLPDVTVADALQRIAGIQIQRNAGEGSTVNIRGLPQVVTLLNGEQYLSPGNLGSAQPNLNDVPAQLMNSIVVFKSMDVRNALSGISGTIDLRTRRPFDFGYGLTTAEAVEYATGEDTRENDYLFNALVNWRNDRFGFLLSAVKSEANLGNNYSGISGGPFGNNDWGGADDNWIAPHGYDSFKRVVERDRLGANGAFTWQINDGFELTGEVFYAKLEEHNRAAGLNISNRWSGLGWTTPTAFDQTGVNGSNGEPWLDVTEYDLDVWWLNSFTVNRTTENETTNYNLELKYDRGGPFKWSARAIKADASLLSMNGQVQGDLSDWTYSADRTFTLFRDPLDRTRGTFYPANIAALYPASQYSNGIVGSNGGRYVNPNPLGISQDPLVHLNIGGDKTVWSRFDQPIAGGLGAGRTLQDYMANQDSYAVAAFSSEGNQRNESQLEVARTDGSYEFEGDGMLGFVTRIDVGLRHAKRDVQIENFHLFSDFYAGNGATSPNGCSAQWKAIDVVMNQNQCQAGEQVPNPAFNPGLPVSATNQPTVFQGYTVNRPTKLYTHNNTYFMSDYGSITQGLPGVWVVDPRDFDDVVDFQTRVFGSAYPVIIPGNSYDVGLTEDSAYVNGGISFGRLSGDVGIKMIRTKLDVRQNLTGETRNYGDTNLDVGDTYSSRRYSDYLPSINLMYDFSDQLKLRAAYNKTMIPLDLGNYGGGVTISTSDSLGPTPTDPTAPPVGVRRVTGATFAGSPSLNPWRSDNYDLSLEYYLGSATLFNVALFKLEIDSFVTRATVNDGEFPDQDGVIRRIVPVNRPVQGEGGSLQGVEVGAKIALSDVLPEDSAFRDFGFDGSYTFSDSSSNATDLSGEDLPFPDNSEHQVNAALWYQGDRLQTRVAYNFRTPRLATTFGQIPIYQDTAQYVDVNVTYDLTENITIYANGSNVLGEIEEYYFEFEDGAEQFHSRNEFEPRYSIGLRARF
ncbi:TonB-dependent receptor [Brevundimonas sp. PAMC22021]|uniref:TonB-dependent receptor n=1 Tax=Brevundimonas sp. PAMC22021 TaxID=2861285 RepID=UPI001C636E99|nr:TonB-dependent receptor [Brevundimonas sp. PAMC22021]QYF88144.1 TonB-dependent receptor [Brevundimonas sp. PAMC22021]